MVQPPAQGGQLAFGKAGADTTGIMQGAGIVIVSHVQRSQTGARALGRRPAEYDELLTPLAFQLAPGVAASGTVRRVGLLRDDALQAHGAGLQTHGGALPTMMIAVAEPATPIVETLEDRFAIFQ